MSLKITMHSILIFFINSINVIILMITTIKLQKKRVARETLKEKLSLPPGPAPWPIVGNIPELIRKKPTSQWIDRMMKQMSTDICLIRLWKTNIVTINCPKLACEVVKKNDAIFSSRPKTFAAKCMTGGYLTTILVPYCDQWKKMRKVLLSEIFSPARHRWLHDKRAEEADNLVFYIRNQSIGNRNVNLRTATRHYCGNVTRKIIYGKRYFGEGMPDGGPGAEEIKHVDAAFTALKHVYAFALSDYIPFLQGLDFDGQEKIILDANNAIREYQNPLIDERIKKWRRGEIKEVEDLLDVFISLTDSDGKPLLTQDEIENQMAEIMLATIDNPSNAVEWAMAEMLNQPEILQKATKELDRVAGTNRLVQESDIPNLNYVKACIREAFRLHPVSYFNPPHVALQDTTIGGYFIPKGSWALLSRVGLGRNPKTWENPLKFDRHINGSEVVLTEHDLKFVTFSTGRRGCIAPVLGTCMTTMLLARMLQCFTWNLPIGSSGVDLSEAADSLIPANPVMAFAKPRLAHLYPTLA